MEPKILYRSAVEQVPTQDYTLPLSKAEILTPGNDITVIGWGSQIYVLEQAIEMAKVKVPGLSVELIDLRTIYPFDVDTIVKVFFCIFVLHCVWCGQYIGIDYESIYGL